MKIPYVVQHVIFEFCLIEDLYKFMRIPICQKCAKQRYKQYNIVSFTDFPHIYRSSIEFTHKRVLDAAACYFIGYNRLPDHLRFRSCIAFPSYIRHRIIIDDFAYRSTPEYADDINYEITLKTILRVIISPNLTLKVARKIGYKLNLAGYMREFKFLLHYRSELLFPGGDVSNQSLWNLVGLTIFNTQALVAVLEVYNPPLRYLRVIICHLLMVRDDVGFDYILNRFTPLQYPMFFRSHDPLTIAIAHYSKYIPILLNLNLFHAYRDYSVIVHEQIHNILQAQHQIKTPSTAIIRSKLALVRY